MYKGVKKISAKDIIVSDYVKVTGRSNKCYVRDHIRKHGCPVNRVKVYRDFIDTKEVYCLLDGWVTLSELCRLHKDLDTEAIIECDVFEFKNRYDVYAFMIKSNIHNLPNFWLAGEKLAKGFNEYGNKNLASYCREINIPRQTVSRYITLYRAMSFEEYEKFDSKRRQWKIIQWSKSGGTVDGIKKEKEEKIIKGYRLNLLDCSLDEVVENMENKGLLQRAKEYSSLYHNANSLFRTLRSDTILYTNTSRFMSNLAGLLYKITVN